MPVEGSRERASRLGPALRCLCAPFHPVPCRPAPRGGFVFREDSRGHLPEGMENDSVFVPGMTREILEDVEARNLEVHDVPGSR